MATLAGNTIASTYPLLLKIDSSGIDGTLRAVQDGDATDSALSIATDSVLVKGSGIRLYFHDADGGEHIAGDGTDLTITSGADIILAGTAVNITADTIDLSDATKDVTLNAAVDALNFDSNTLSIDASNNRIGIGTAAPTAQLSLVSGTYGFENLFGMTDHACLGLGLGPGSTSNQIRTVIGTTHGMGFMHTASATAGSAKLQVVTTAENSTAGAVPTRLATFLADGKVGILTDSPSHSLDILGANATVGSGSSVLAVFSSSAYNTANTGGSIGFQGKKNTGGDYSENAWIGGLKENTTNANDAGYLAFGTRPNGGAVAERMRITSAGNVVIAGGEVQNNSGEFTFRNTTDGENISFRTQAANTERLKIHSGGNVEVKTGNLVIGTSGKGIDFTAEAASGETGADRTGSILDDYEEGTWTPVIRDANSGGNAGSITNTGSNYTKIGNTVVLRTYMSAITTSGMTSGNGFFIHGLPFTSDGVAAGNFYSYRVGMESATVSRAATVGNDITYITLNLFALASSVTDSKVLVSGIVSGTSEIMLSVTYHVD